MAAAVGGWVSRWLAVRAGLFRLLFAAGLLLSLAVLPAAARVSDAEKQVIVQINASAKALNVRQVTDAKAYRNTVRSIRDGFIRLDGPAAESVKGAGAALVRIYLSPPTLAGDAGFPGSVRAVALEALSASRGQWATDALVDLWSKAPAADRASLRAATLKQVGARRDRAFMGGRSDAAVRLMIASGRPTYLYDPDLQALEQRAFTLPVLVAEGSKVPDTVVQYYAEVFLVGAWGAPRDKASDALVQKGVQVYLKRGDRLTLAVRDALNDLYAARDPKGYLKSPAAKAPQTAADVRRLYAAAAALPPADKQRPALVAAATVRLPAVIEVPAYIGENLALAAAAAKSGPEARAVLRQHLLVDKPKPDVEAALFIALAPWTAEADEALDKARRGFVSDRLAKASLEAQVGFLDYAGPALIRRDPDAALRPLQAYARTQQDGRPFPDVAFADIYAGALAATNPEDLPSSAVSNLRNLIRRAPAPVMAVLQRRFSALPAAAMGSLLIKGVGPAVQDGGVNERAAILAVLATALKPKATELDADARRKLGDLYARAIDNETPIDGALYIARYGFWVLGPDADAREKLRTALARRLTRPDAGAFNAGAGLSSAGGLSESYVRPGSSFAYSGGLFSGRAPYPVMDTVARRELGLPAPDRGSPTVGQPDFGGTVADSIVLLNGEATYQVYTGAGPSIRTLVLFDDQGRMFATPRWNGDWSGGGGLRPGSIGLALTFGSGAIQADGSLRISAGSGFDAARRKLQMRFTVNGVLIGDPIELAPDFDAGAAWALDYTAAAGAAGRSGQAGYNGQQGQGGGLGDPSQYWAGTGGRGYSGTPGSDGGDGSNGTPGANGADARAVYVVASPIEDSVARKRLFLVTVYPENRSYILSDKGVLKLTARGGAGGAGGAGGDAGSGGGGGSGGQGGQGGQGRQGAQGAPGAYCNYVGCNCNGGQGREGEWGGRGGQGGDGARGGDTGRPGSGAYGGLGGRGGRICVIYDGPATELTVVARSLSVDVSGGRGGAGGRVGGSGQPGQGGYPGPGGSGGMGGMGGLGGMAGQGTVFNPNGTSFPLYCGIGNMGNMGGMGQQGNDGRGASSGSVKGGGSSGSSGSNGADGSFVGVVSPGFRRDGLTVADLEGACAGAQSLR